jgi:hypothetical protein
VECCWHIGMLSVPATVWRSQDVFPEKYLLLKIFFLVASQKCTCHARLRAVCADCAVTECPVFLIEMVRRVLLFFFFSKFIISMLHYINL